MNDDFGLPPIVELEPQPHGGALKRSHAVDDVDLSDGSGTLTAKAYQDQLLAAAPAVYTSAHDRLACELALDMEDPEAIFARYGLSEEEALKLMSSPAFIALCSKISKEVRESGLSFKMKARAQAEELLGHSWVIATDPLAPMAVRADMIKWTTKVAGLEPKEKDAGAGQGGFSLNITFAGEAPVKVVAHEAIEHQP